MRHINILGLWALAAAVNAAIAFPAMAVVPELAVSAALDKSGATLTVVLTPAASAVQCSYSVLGADQKKELRLDQLEGIPLIDVPAREGATVLQASGLKLIKKGQVKKPKAFFLVQIQCGNEVGSSAVVKLKLKAGKKGVKSVDKWLGAAANVIAEQVPAAQRP